MKRAFAAHVIDMAELAAEGGLGGLSSEDFDNAEDLARERGWDDVLEGIRKYRAGSA